MEQKILIFKFLFITFVCFTFNINAQSQEIITGKATVIDGDTIKIGKNTIRLEGIDAPESKQTCFIENKEWECGKEATTALINLINLKEVNCKTAEKDRYKRDIAECYINNQNINKIMVRQGWAIAYRFFSIQFVDDEEFAKKNKLGLWRGDFMEPYLYRKTNKK